ncbi:DUF6801 domain-containing protein [Saccharothrix syringae]|uniref:DUF6801 domain-containing protein n=1 Tax=Saccharothrix syringae TaxID=103733 RepID=A0A5Q0H6G7_SACSY|nr:DUF6801 domain-containing protein [Saccharothrix syringae]QFZ21505.1 hypothetical protein EKG83_32610 [Saccharothrix syringae]
MLKLNSAARRVFGGFAVATAVAGTILTAGAGVGQAATASLTLVYNCPFPLIGAQDMSVRIDVANLPTSGRVGVALPATTVTATATVPSTATLGLALVGAKTVEGTAKAQTTVNNAGTLVPVAPDLVVAKTNVPSNGSSFPTVATGSTAPLTLTKAGTTTITVGNFSTTLTPRKGDGSLTGLGTFTSNCTLKPNQATTLYTFPVTA